MNKINKKTTDQIQNKVKMRLSVFNSILLVTILCYLIIGSIASGKKDNQVYVVTGELFAEFDYQKELDLEFTAIKNEKERDLELLKNDVISLENAVKSGQASEETVISYQYKLGQYQQAEHTVQTELATLNNQYSTMIWSKLNEFVKSFGEENQYDVIFGADGTGNIMYADDQMNVTDEVIQYCNLKYSGK